MSFLYLDFETRSSLDLRKTGVHRLLEDPHTKIILAAAAFDDDEPELIPGCPQFEEDVVNHVAFDGTVICHNAPFEIAMSQLWIAKLTPEQCICTMALALQHNLPASLDGAAKALKLPYDKDGAGHALMLRMCRPRNRKAMTWWEDEPEYFKRLGEYCVQDVRVTRELYKRLHSIPTSERLLWLLDQKINARGVHTDLKHTRHLSNICKATKAELDRQIREATDGRVSSCAASVALAKELEIPDVTRDTVDKLLGDPDLKKAFPGKARLLELRQEAAKSSTSKLAQIQQRRCQDGRVRGLFQFAGAGQTSRWAGRGIQVQNLPRPQWPARQLEAALGYSIAELDFYFGSPMAAASSMLRSLFVAPPGKKLVCVDFDAIEGRVLAYLAGETWVLDVYRTTGKMYEATAGRLFGIDPDNVTKDSRERQGGKVAELAWGYGGGVNAFLSMEASNGLALGFSEEYIASLRDAWREARPRTVAYWKYLERTSFDAVLEPEVRQGPFLVHGGWLWFKLLSGRNLAYFRPKILPVETPWGEVKNQVTYLNSNLQRMSTHGGKLAENETQATARDILGFAMLSADKAGWDLVLHCHDELVAEEPIDGRPLSELIRLVSVTPEWAEGLPLSASGWEGSRYRK